MQCHVHNVSVKQQKCKETLSTTVDFFITLSYFYHHTRTAQQTEQPVRTEIAKLSAKAHDSQTTRFVGGETAVTSCHSPPHRRESFIVPRPILTTSQTSTTQSTTLISSLFVFPLSQPQPPPGGDCLAPFVEMAQSPFSTDMPSQTHTHIYIHGVHRM